VSGVWIRARKLEGELDVGQRRIVRLVGESIVATAEPAGSMNGYSSRIEVRLPFGVPPSPNRREGWRIDTSQGSDGFIAL